MPTRQSSRTTGKHSPLTRWTSSNLRRCPAVAHRTFGSKVAARCTTNWDRTTRSSGLIRPSTSIRFMQAAQERGVPVEVLDVTPAEADGLYSMKLTLVRPDQYVAWRGNAVPDEPLKLIDVVRGASRVGSSRQPPDSTEFPRAPCPSPTAQPTSPCRLQRPGRQARRRSGDRPQRPCVRRSHVQ